ncbi:maltose/maltodextrin ABC transporter substrate-binding protein MalE [Roseateles sp. BYS87W]|uniref:Maltose/maltodextrin ABC transporter substrate-binding protein MalE n=1 Tax=Pelomonas baiyunensis TaxID=3299026 RepID=A0ABW7GYD7_9BURK
MLTRRQLGVAGLSCAWASGREAAAAPAAVGQQAPLVVWFTVQGAAGMRRVAERFTAATGVPVVIETPDDGPSKFQQAASAGKGPDIYSYSHDRLGEWVAGGLLQAVSPPRALREDITPVAWEGFTWQGRVWGYPYAIESVALIYNRRLVPQPPKTFDEVVALDDRLQRQGRRAILWDYTNNYFSWPLLAARGPDAGYAFQRRPDGSFDARDTGVAQPGAVRGAALIARLVQEGRMPAGSGYAEMEAALATGRVAMMINGPWSWVNLQRVGVDFGVVPVPAVGGAAASPFVGVRGMMINRACRQREVAIEFLEHFLLTPEGLRDLDAAEPIGAAASQRFLAELLQRPNGHRIAGLVASARDGVVTPSIPEMGRFWAAMKSALTAMTEGRQGAAEALAGARQRILEAGL